MTAVSEPCSCISCCSGAPAISSEEHRKHVLAKRNGEIAAGISERVRLGLMDPADAAEAVRKLGR